MDKDSGTISFRHMPLCLAKLRVSAAHGGAYVRCPVCGKPVLVPLSALQKAEQRIADAHAKEAFWKASNAAAKAARAERMARDAERQAAATERHIADARAAAAPGPARPYSPLHWGFGIGCGLILAQVAALLVFLLWIYNSCAWRL